jgi:hypothetical protein
MNSTCAYEAFPCCARHRLVRQPCMPQGGPKALYGPGWSYSCMPQGGLTALHATGWSCSLACHRGHYVFLWRPVSPPVPMDPPAPQQRTSTAPALGCWMSWWPSQRIRHAGKPLEAGSRLELPRWHVRARALCQVMGRCAGRSAAPRKGSQPSDRSNHSSSAHPHATTCGKRQRRTCNPLLQAL